VPARQRLPDLPLFITTAEFLPGHRRQHQQTLQIISAAQARGQTRMAEMNQQVADSLQWIITALEADQDPQEGVAPMCPETAAALVAAAKQGTN
jgi:hypothetical protein